MGFCGRGAAALALFEVTAFEAAFGFNAGLDVDDLGFFPLASERGFTALDTAFTRLAGFVFILAREGLDFAETDFGFFAASLAAFRLAAGLALEAAFREGAGLAAALPRLVVFAMVLASIPPAGIACGHHLRAAARLQFKRGF